MQPEILNAHSRTPLILLCDHASRHIPDEYGNLGLSSDALEDHIAWDIGAAAVTRHIDTMMGIPAVLAPASRLLLDTNRAEEDESRIPLHVDGYDITGNMNLCSEERDHRHQRFYQPFHTAAETLINKRMDEGIRPAIVAIHSFSPTWHGQIRPWQLGLMWNSDHRMAQALTGLLERETDLHIGENEPWSGKDLFHTLHRHGEQRGLPHAGIEIRNDLIREEARILEMAALLADLLDECMSRNDLG